MDISEHTREIRKHLRSINALAATADKQARSKGVSSVIIMGYSYRMQPYTAGKRLRIYLDGVYSARRLLVGDRFQFCIRGTGQPSAYEIKALEYIDEAETEMSVKFELLD